MAARVGSLSAADLAPVVRRALGVDDAWPTGWRFEKLGWTVVNPATLALYRVEGTARVGSQPDVPWVVVVKIVGDVPGLSWTGVAIHA